MPVKRQFCSYCSITFSLAEERIFYDGAVYHPECDQTRLRQEKVREIFRIKDHQSAFIVVPRHHISRMPDPPKAA